MHNGTITVESCLNVGSVFKVVIPYGRDHLPQDKVINEPSKCSSPATADSFVQESLGWFPSTPYSSSSEDSDNYLPDPQSITVLVVDDNADMRRYIHSLLSPHYQTVVVEDGLAAINVLNSSEVIDIILSDSMMPRMNGMQLLNAVRTHQEWKSIPFILISARTGEEAKIEAIDAGADDHIAKPFSSKVLLSRIKVLVELRRQHNELEERVRQRTQELYKTHESLRQEVHERIKLEQQSVMDSIRLKSAKEFREKQQEFVDTVCHEIRNPLNGVFGCTDGLHRVEVKLREMVEHGCINVVLLAEQLEAIKEITSNLTVCAEQQRVIVDDVLDLSKLDNNKLKLNLKAFSPKQVILTTLQMFQQRLDNKKFITRLGDDDFYILSDGARFNQIIINLISNAIKFTVQGSITITLDRRETLDGNVLVEVHIIDTGIGMSDSTISQLFQPFTQGGSDITERFGGTGLGLAICKKLVTMMGGAISAKSNKGVGSDFCFTISAALSKIEPLLRSKSGRKSNPPIPRSHDVPSRHILVVEDNLINQKILARYLRDAGHSYKIAANGLEAINIYKQDTFNLIFMDIEMPVMNGLESTIQIRSYELTNKLPRVAIVGLSGNARPEHIEEAKQVGMDGYITKPYHSETLHNHIKRVWV
ncbi:hypothetical protein AKO1_004027, partial [Acrasis kona]